MIKYLGSKRLLVPDLLAVVAGLADVRTVLDVFAGTSRVGHALKRAGYRVIANDHNAYAATLARCYVQADAEDVLEDARTLIDELSRVPPRAGYFTETFCVKSRFVQPKNGERIDAIREAIRAKSLAPELEAVLLVSLMEAADRVDSTTGVQMAYLKQWAARSHNDLALRVPDVLPRATHGKGRALELDALDVGGAVRGERVDVAYLDPPYNQHRYLGNYHVWETLVRWDAPEVYGVACKRVDARERRSVFNSKRAFVASFRALVASLDARYLVVSFNDEGFLAPAEAEAILAERGPVEVLARDYRRYVGARIGIYNPKGEKVGAVSHVENRELIFVVGPTRSASAT